MNIATVHKNSLLLSSLDVRPIYDPQLPPLLPQAQQNDVAGHFPMPFGLLTMYRIYLKKIQ